MIILLFPYGTIFYSQVVSIIYYSMVFFHCFLLQQGFHFFLQIFSASETVTWEEAKGRISAEMIAPYPPGIPVIYPGERMSDEVWAFLEEYRARGAHLQGPADPKLNTLRVIKESDESMYRE